jgi:hypothetical protein
VRESGWAGLVRVEKLEEQLSAISYQLSVCSSQFAAQPSGNHFEITNAIYPALGLSSYDFAWIQQAIIGETPTGAKSRGSGLNFLCASGGLTGWAARSRRSCGSRM